MQEARLRSGGELRIYEFFEKKRNNKPHPVVLGLPGLVTRDERTRIDRLFQQVLMPNGYECIRLTYPGINNVGNDIICDLDPDRYAKTVLEAMSYIAGNPDRFDAANVNIVASSVSAYFLTTYLALKEKKKPNVTIKKVASISPLAGWVYYRDGETREQIQWAKGTLSIIPDQYKDENRQKQVQIPNVQENDKIRIVSSEWIRSLRNLDGIQLLAKGIREGTFSPLEIEVLTLIGTKDMIVDQRSMHDYHFWLGGVEDGIRLYDSGHSIPEGQTTPALESFFLGEQQPPSIVRISSAA